ICGVDTSKLPLMKEEEKIRLLGRVRQGDSLAREKLICGNLRLVLSVIQRFMNRGEHPDDLFQVGCIGLIKAIDRFELSIGVRFSTYAVPMILGEVRRFLRDNNTVRVTRSLRDIAYRAMVAREKLQNERSVEPSVKEIADELGIEVSDLVLALEAVVEPVSLYEPIYTDGGADEACVFEQISCSSCPEEDWLCELSFRKTLESLSEREKKILQLRFVCGQTQTEVARSVGISQAQVSRLEKSSLARIKAGM
ncbi:MAG: SigB/SigF/SigG family RNA polymerase sigma factor, partial [Oscillospiraceae bacterium]|nr:SigB/SigF/SigG family RNA polymerase sigma factor [Oscillospiraceae bacterium]